MEQTSVGELASEFTLQSSIVISELKKIGVWVPSSDTPVDNDIANRIRRRLQLLIELEQEDQVKAEKPKEKRKAKQKARKTIKKLAKPRKGPKVEEQPAESPLAVSLKPRKGKKVYRTLEPVEGVPQEKTEVTIEEQPIIEKVEATLSAELAEKIAAEPAEKGSKEAVESAAPEPRRTRLRKVEKPEAAPAAKEKEVARVVPIRAKLRPKLLKKTATESPAVEATAIARHLVKPTVGEKAKKPAARPSTEAAPPPKKEEVAKIAEKREVAEIREVTLSEAVTIKELSEKFEVKSKDILKELLSRGVLATINQALDQKIVEEISTQFGFIPHFVSFEEEILEGRQVSELPEDLVTRAPVVTVMGHVDHGKTSLLDAIRETSVAAGEAGGITQHVGAYHVNLKDRRIVFLDTPGHEAFTMMRARGAQATDIVVLVVAADDGVMPQTIEAINHAQAAKVPILVAINKIDKPDAQAQRVKQQLAEHQLVAEDWQGDTVMVEISATEKTHLDVFLEMILLVADMLEIKANPKRPGSGVVLEAKVDKGRGTVATALVQDGTLRVGDSLVAGATYGKIRALFDDRGNPLIEAEPSSAVEMLGLQELPQAGDHFQVIDDTLKAREIGEYRRGKLREQELARSSRLSLDQLHTHMESEDAKELPLVLKADVSGSVEVLQDTLEKLSTGKVRIQIIHSGVGAISESDILLASASNAIVIGFHVRPERNAQELAEREGVEVRLYTIIYEVSQAIREAMLGLLEPTFREAEMGRAEVRETFRAPKFGTIAGSHVQNGAITRNCEVRLLRDNVVIYEGRVDSLRRFKEDVSEVKEGYECGISIANFNDVKIGDVIEAFTKEKVEPQLA